MDTRSSRVVLLAVRVYGLGVRLLPESFQAGYGDELRACFSLIASEARLRGRFAVVAATALALSDLVSQAGKRGRSPGEAQVPRRAGWGGLWTDVRHAARRLRRRPSFTLTTVATLGLGMAAATSVFSLVHGVVLSPLPYPSSARIVEIDHSGPGAGADRGLGITHGFYRYYAAHARTADAMAMYANVEHTLAGRGEPVRLTGTAATPSLGSVLRVPAQLGRWFTAADAAPGAPYTVVLSYGLWQSRFGGDPSVIGSSIDLEGVPHQIVGVMPSSFAFPSADAAFWVPISLPSVGVGGWTESAVARLAPGAAAPTLQQELASLFPGMRAATDDPDTLQRYLDDARVRPLVVPLKESLVGDVRATLWILLGAVSLVLLIAVANVANLFLVRAEEGHRETAVCSALGAGRWRIVRAFTVETALVSLAAGVVGAATAAAAIRALRARAPVDLPRIEEVGLDFTALVGVVLMTLGAAILLGVIPGLRVTSPAAAFAEGGPRTTASRARRRGRDALMATQVALAFVLLIGSGLLFRTFVTLRAIDVGFSASQALTFEIGLPGSRYASRAEAKEFQDQLLERVRAIPGVTNVGAVGSCLPLVGQMCGGRTLHVEGRPEVGGEVPPVTGVRTASVGYFDALGISVRGRSFVPGDERGSATVALLSEAAAAAYFPGEDPMGRRFRFSPEGPWHAIVGVAGDVRGQVETAEADILQRLVYLPMLPDASEGPGPGQLAYVLRTTVPPLSVAPAVRNIVADLDPAIPVANVQTLGQVVSHATAPTAFALTLIGVAAALALLLGVVGVYAVVAYAVSRRTGEIGVRMALGARAGDVRAMVLLQGGRIVFGGMAIGLVAAIGLTRLMRGILYGISPTDTVSYVVVTVFMAFVAAIALWLPARKASRVDPVEALRRA